MTLEMDHINFEVCIAFRLCSKLAGVEPVVNENWPLNLEFLRFRSFLIFVLDCLEYVATEVLEQDKKY